MIIGLTGSKAAGKGVVADYLVSKGFTYLSLSDIVRLEVKSCSMELTAKNLRDTGNELREKFGPGILAERVIGQIEQKKGDYVIDGIRNPAEVEALRTLEGFLLIAVDADRMIRYKRILARGREDAPKSFEEFLEIDSGDLGDNESQTGHKVRDTMGLADFLIMNDGSSDDLLKKVDGFLAGQTEGIL